MTGATGEPGAGATGEPWQSVTMGAMMARDHGRTGVDRLTLANDLGRGSRS